MFVSTSIARSSTPAEAVAKALRTATVLASLDTWHELEDVLMRSKFDKYRTTDLRRDFLQYMQVAVELISVHTHLHICREPKDDKLLALALDGNADFIITGDKDLLVLHPFRGIPILTPLDYLAL
jgi:putative PIN family toxin of toxin-antitoxin system